jgi:dTDP-4-dehydrorhamnose reductase
MAKILVLGGGGMLGHKIYQACSKQHDTYVTLRKYDSSFRKKELFEENKVLTNVDAMHIESIYDAINKVKPDIILNCIGIIKQLKEAKDYSISIYINSLFPHLLSDYIGENAKLIHISTDCIFSGKTGNYKDNDFSDAEDLYGRTKYLGEVNASNCLTLRTSIIGHELQSSHSLIDWFLSQNNKNVKGYLNAIYTGFPTITLSNEIIRIIDQFPNLSGVLNISSEKISKYHLLGIVKNTYGLNIDLQPFEEFFCDRSLDSRLYRETTGFVPKNWEEMIEEMYHDYKENY